MTVAWEEYALSILPVVSCFKKYFKVFLWNIVNTNRTLILFLFLFRWYYSTSIAINTETIWNGNTPLMIFIVLCNKCNKSLNGNNLTHFLAGVTQTSVDIQFFVVNFPILLQVILFNINIERKKEKGMSTLIIFIVLCNKCNQFVKWNDLTHFLGRGHTNKHQHYFF